MAYSFILATGVTLASFLAMVLFVISKLPALIAVLQRPPAGPRPEVTLDEFLRLQQRVAELQLEVDKLPAIWKDQADRANAAAKRAAHHSKRAEQLALQAQGDPEPGSGDPGDEASSGPEGVPPVLAGVGLSPELALLRRQIALM